MVNFSEPFRCATLNRDIYAVPTIRGVVWFDCLRPWSIHQCEEHSCKSDLPGMRNFAEGDLLRRGKGDGSEPAVICCVKRLKPGWPDAADLHLVALKTLTGGKYCEFFEGHDRIVPGDLALILKQGDRRRLLTASSPTGFEFDGSSKPELLGLSRHWLSAA